MTRARVVAASVVVILLVTVRPWYGFVGHSHWDLVEWIPFSHGVRVFDCVANVLLFVPFGAAIAWKSKGGSPQATPTRLPRWGPRKGGPRVLSRIVAATAAGALLSMTVELYQVYCHGHFPTMTDVLTNTTGTWLGAWLGTRSFVRSAKASALATRAPGQD